MSLLTVGASLLGIGSVSAANAEDAAVKAGFVATATPSFMTFQSFTVKFDQAVMGLTLDDFVVDGSAQCQPTALEIAPNWLSANIDVSKCSVGIVFVSLKANSVDGLNAVGPAEDVFSNKVEIVNAPQIGMPSASILTSAETELSVGDQFLINFDMPVGELVKPDSIQVWGDAKCELGGINKASDNLSMTVWMKSCHDGEVGITLLPFSVHKDDGSCCGPQLAVKSQSLKVAHFGLADSLEFKKGGPANPPSVNGHVTGVVWFDLNLNNVQEANEPGLPGATVALDNEQTLVTGANGEYDFGDATPGIHSVSVTLPWQLRVSADSEGVEDGVARVQVAAGAPAGTWFAVAGNSFMSANFNDPQGNPLTEPVVVAWIGIDGIADTADDVFFTAPVSGDGSYLLKNVPAGDYRVLMSGNQALTGELTLAEAAYDMAAAEELQRDVNVKYKDLAYTGGSPWDFGLLAFGLAALAGGWVLLRRSKLS